jgi:outer membrane protein assembly factor BamB
MVTVPSLAGVRIVIRTCAVVLVLLVAFISRNANADDDIDRKFPLDPQLAVLARDVTNETYRKLVLEKMLITDLAAEWQRVATADNADSFLEKYGGKDKVMADADLKRAYERRVQIRSDFLDLMRQGYKRYKKSPPFDQGVKAELAGTLTKSIAASAETITPVMPSPGAERNWPRFRGPSGQGIAVGAAPPVEWDAAGKNILWRTKVPGRGNSSPVVWGDRIFLTSANDKGGNRSVHCFDRANGHLLWTKVVPVKPPEPGVRDKNGFATSTPVTDGERVIVFLGSSGLACFDFAGTLQWHYADFAVRTIHGTGSSPLLYDDLVILVQDQNQAISIFLALDKRTGKVVWQSERGRAMTWSTPIVVRVGGRDELVMAGQRTVKGYDPRTGRELWSLDGPTEEVIPNIVAGPTLLYSASGRNGPTLALRPGGTGDVTETHLAWRAVRNGPHVPSPALVKGRLFTANDTGVFTCLDAATGKLIYSERVNDHFSASPVTAGDLMWFASESGRTYVVRAADHFEPVAKNDLGSPILASLAAIDGTLILRTQDELVCVGVKEGRR